MSLDSHHGEYGDLPEASLTRADRRRVADELRQKLVDEKLGGHDRIRRFIPGGRFDVCIPYGETLLRCTRLQVVRMFGKTVRYHATIHILCYPPQGNTTVDPYHEEIDFDVTLGPSPPLQLASVEPTYDETPDHAEQQNDARRRLWVKRAFIAATVMGMITGEAMLDFPVLRTTAHISTSVWRQIQEKLLGYDSPKQPEPATDPWPPSAPLPDWVNE